MSLPLLETSEALYSSLIADLGSSGKGVKEAGAFLLGAVVGSRRRIESYLMYDIVAPESARDHSYVALTAVEMARAWDHCYRSGLEVVADIHTHPFGPAQSVTDRAHPIVSMEGHVALIAPHFALRDPRPSDLGVHVFQGAGRWCSMFGQQASEAFQIR
jgi:proteasome lid subunit RPN8/RPN11